MSERMIEIMRVYLHDTAIQAFGAYDNNAAKPLSELASNPAASMPTCALACRLPTLKLVHNMRGGKSGCIVAVLYSWRMGFDWMPDIPVRLARYWDIRKA